MRFWKKNSDIDGGIIECLYTSICDGECITSRNHHNEFDICEMLDIKELEK